MAAGDFNQSFNPLSAKTTSENLALNISGSRQAVAGEEFELPIYASNPMEVSAISMIVNFPAEKLELTGIGLGDSNTPVEYGLTGNELRIGWQSLTPLALNAGEPLVTLRLRATASLTEGETVRLTLAGSDLNELAGADYDVIQGAVLFVNQIDGAVGEDEVTSTGKLAFANFPNPFTQQTTFTYTLPEAGFVTIGIYNLLGSQVATLVKEDQKAGNHALTLDTDFVAPGVYVAVLRLNTGGKTYDRVIKIIRNQ